MTKKDRSRNRLGRRLTSPPELFYALTRHWFLLSLITVVGSVFTLGKLLTDAPVYQARSVISISPGEAAWGDGNAWGRLEAETFFHSRVALLTSDEVIGDVVKGAGYAPPPSWSPSARLSDLGHIGDIAIQVRSVFQGALNAFSSGSGGSARNEVDLQAEIRAFLARTDVRPDSRSRTVNIGLLGSSEGVVERDLKRWIEVYSTKKVEVPSRGGGEAALSSNQRQWGKREKDAYDAVVAAEARSRELFQIPEGIDPQVFLVQEANEVTDRIDDLRDELRDLRSGDPAESRRPAGGRPASRETDPTVAKLTRDQADLEAQLRALRSKGYPETNNEVRSLVAQLEVVDEELRKALEGEEKEPELVAGDSAAPGGGPTLDQRKKELQDGIESLRDRKAQLLSLGEDLKEKRKEHETASAMLEQVEQEARMREALMESRLQTRVEWSGSPTVGTYLINKKKKALQGVVLSAVAGICLALLLEVLNGKVRFQNDVSEEFSLQVVGVIPKK